MNGFSRAMQLAPRGRRVKIAMRVAAAVLLVAGSLSLVRGGLWFHATQQAESNGLSIHHAAGIGNVPLAVLFLGGLLLSLSLVIRWKDS